MQHIVIYQIKLWRRVFLAYLSKKKDSKMNCINGALLKLK